MTGTPAPRLLTAFPSARPVKPKTPFGGGLRRRWRDPKGRIYEWDYQHGAVEVYDAHGRHQGEYDAQTGERLKNAQLGRTIEV